MLEAELSSLVLDCAAWGADPAGLSFLDPPPAGTVKAARALLRDLDALDGEGRITETGRRMARLGTHPRLARMPLDALASHHAPLPAVPPNLFPADADDPYAAVTAADVSAFLGNYRLRDLAPRYSPLDAGVLGMAVAHA